MSPSPTLASDTARQLTEYLQRLRDTPPDQRPTDTAQTFKAGAADIHVELTDTKT